MAILSKIRERSMFLIAVIGLALFAFVASPKDIMDFFNSNKINEIGNIGGEPVSRKEFVERAEAYKANAGANSSEIQVANMVWNSIVSEYLYKSQLEAAGVVIGEQDVWNAIIANPSIKGAPAFQNELGAFDENKLKEYLANLKQNAPSNWNNWLQNEKNIKNGLRRDTYNNLLRMGIGASTQEGQVKYLEEQTKLSGSFVYLPYSSVADSIVSVSQNEIEAYVEAHPKAFKQEESRDIRYVKFALKASAQDEKDIENALTNLINDRTVYNPISKANEVELGFKNAIDMQAFFEVAQSDLPVDEAYEYEDNLPAPIAEEMKSASENTVIGPYKFKDYYRLTKVVGNKQLPDSVKANHILIAYAGSRAADPSITRTETQAQQLADSIASVIKKQPSQLKELAADLSADQSNASKSGELDWFTYNQMVPEFRDYCFENKKGDVGVVKTIFGYHVIKIAGQKNFKNAIKSYTVGRKIEASEQTENNLFEEAEMFALDLSSGKDFETVAKEKNYNIRTVNAIPAMEESITGIGKNRAVVRWTFDGEVALGDSKRFDLEDKGYVVVQLTNKTAEGLQSALKATAKVKPILVKEKKQAILAEKLSGNDLNEIAKNTNSRVRKFNAVVLNTATLSGVGREKEVVAAIYAANDNTLTNPVFGEKGVFAFVKDKTEAPKEANTLEGYKNQLTNTNKGRLGFQAFNVLKEMTEIKDNRAMMY